MIFLDRPVSVQCIAKMAKRIKAEEEEPQRPQVPMPPDERIVLPTLTDSMALSREDVKLLCDGVTQPNRQKFLIALAQLGNRTRAAKAAGVSTVSTWIWRRDDADFAAAYTRAMEMAGELHEDELFRRSSEGVLEPVFQGGELVGSIRRFSDTLLIFGLKGAMPDKYADRHKVEVKGDMVARLHNAREKALGRSGGSKK